MRYAGGARLPPCAVTLNPQRRVFYHQGHEREKLKAERWSDDFMLPSSILRSTVALGIRMSQSRCRLWPLRPQVIPLEVFGKGERVGFKWYGTSWGGGVLSSYVGLHGMCKAYMTSVSPTECRTLTPSFIPGILALSFKL